MIQAFRAAGRAAAAFAFIGAMLSAGPLSAQTAGAAGVLVVADHAAATLQNLAVTDPVAPTAVPAQAVAAPAGAAAVAVSLPATAPAPAVVAAEPVRDHSLAKIASDFVKSAFSFITGKPNLASMVDTYAGESVADAEQECLAGAIYFEARGEPLEGQLAVAEVVLNRVASGKYPPSICGVVKQKAQFSFVRRGGRFPPIARGSDAWRRAVAISHIASRKLAREVASDVLWYHATYVSPSWGRRLNRVGRVGAHIFYS